MKLRKSILFTGLVVIALGLWLVFYYTDMTKYQQHKSEEIIKVDSVEKVGPEDALPSTKLSKIVPPDEQKRCPNASEYRVTYDIKTVNCFPGNPPVFCHPEYRTWIKNNCPGIIFSD